MHTASLQKVLIHDNSNFKIYQNFNIDLKATNAKEIFSKFLGFFPTILFLSVQ